MADLRDLVERNLAKIHSTFLELLKTNWIYDADEGCRSDCDYVRITDKNGESYYLKIELELLTYEEYHEGEGEEEE